MTFWSDFAFCLVLKFFFQNILVNKLYLKLCKVFYHRYLYLGSIRRKHNDRWQHFSQMKDVFFAYENGTG